MRSKELDFLRGIAIILVLFRHYEIFKPLHRAGWIGVDLFFVLSGFLVSGLLFRQYLKHGKVAISTFLIRRGLKIYPMFYLFIAVTLFLDWVLGHQISTRNLFSEIFFVQNYFDSLWAHTWSLAVEEHFYLGLATMIFILARTRFIDNRQFFLILSFSILLSCTLMRYHNYKSFQFHDNTHLFPTHLRIDSLFFGVMISYLFHFENTLFTTVFRKGKIVFLVIAFVLISPAFFLEINSFFMNTLGLCFLYVGFGLVLSVFISIQWKVDQMNVVIRTGLEIISIIGLYSYTIYLFHMFFATYGVNMLVRMSLRPEAIFVIYFGASIMIGVLVAKVVESRILAWRDIYFKSI